MERQELRACSEFEAIVDSSARCLKSACHPKNKKTDMISNRSEFRKKCAGVWLKSSEMRAKNYIRQKN